MWNTYLGKRCTGGSCPTHELFMLPMALALRAHTSVPVPHKLGKEAKPRVGFRGGLWVFRQKVQV